jgi:hypothetical protein
MSRTAHIRYSSGLLLVSHELAQADPCFGNMSGRERRTLRDRGGHWTSADSRYLCRTWD